MNPFAVHGLLWRRFTLRHWRDTPGQSFLLVVILALGIAVYLSIRLANRAATASFQHFTDLVAAESDWMIQAPAGDLPESVLVELHGRLRDAPVHIVPIVESTATQPQSNPPNGEPETIGSRPTFRLLGIDLVGIQNVGRDQAEPAPDWFASDAPSPSSPASAPTDPPADGGVGETPFWRVLRDPTSVFISAALARRENLAPGDRLPLVVNERIVPLTVAGVIPQLPGQPAAPAELLVMDLPALQQWTGRTGRLTRVELRVEPGPNEDERRNQLRHQLNTWATRASASAPGQPSDAQPSNADQRWRVQSPSERREAGAAMTRAFRLNLTLLSLLALLVGMYLVVQALDGAVVRRRTEIGVLRSLGVDAATLHRAWLLEAAGIGLLGGILGIALGWAGAQVSVRLVGRTVNALYYATSAQAAALTSGEVGAALVLAVVAALLAGGWPARNAAAIPPAQLLARNAPNPSSAWALHHPLPGFALVAAGVACALLPPLRFDGGVRFPAGGYLAALFWIAGAGILGSRALSTAARLLQPLGRLAAVARLGISPLTTPSGRHVLAAAGLICAVAMTAGMVILVGSFDRTMRRWIERTFQADLYVSSAGAQSASTDNRLSPDTWRALANDPAVADANVLHGIEVTLPAGTTILAAGNLGFLERHVQLAWVERPTDLDVVFAPTPSAPGIPVPTLVSESFSERFQKHRGDVVEIPTPSGLQQVRIAGVFADYGNERGSLVVDRAFFIEWFQTDLAASVIVALRDPEQAETIRSAWLAKHPGLQILTNRHLRTEVLRIFRQTFSITYALEAIGLTVAVLGLGMTLASILIERRADWTTLRALGMRPSELAAVAAVEGLVVAAVGLVVGLVVSGALGWLLIRVINKQTFGWTLEFAAPPGPLALLATLVLAGATAVSYAVGRWGAELPADREE
ncbi:MAG: FtsX-like permease family protein [Limisphaerales bacterium]